MFLKFCIWLIFLLKLCIKCESANVLMAIPLPLKSHYIMMRNIGFKLAKNGHNVTVLTDFVEGNNLSNYRQIKTNTGEVFKGMHKLNVLEMNELTDHFQHEFYRSFSFILIEAALNSTPVQTFLKEHHKFDVVIGEQFYNEAFNYLAYKYQCPLILVSTFGQCMKHNIAVGNPLQLNTIYSEYIRIYDFGFWSKIKNIYFSIYEYVVWRFWYLSEQEKLARKYLELSEEIPSLFEVQNNVSLFLMNRHYSLDPPATYLPNIVEIGALHLSEEVQRLPEDIKQILDNSPQGVIYISLGTAIQASNLTSDQIKLFIEALRQLKQTVLWKCDVHIDDLPNNVIVRIWFPQTEILAHPNVHLFISHAGLLSVQEAVWYSVPILSIPVFGDQTRNAVWMKHIGMGDLLLPNELDQLQEKLGDVLENLEVYRNNAYKLSSRFRDRRTSALTTAMFWIEHVITHGGEGVRAEGGVHWDDYYNIDVTVIVVFVVIVLLYFVTKSVVALKGFLLKTVYGNSDKKDC